MSGMKKRFAYAPLAAVTVIAALSLLAGAALAAGSPVEVLKAVKTAYFKDGSDFTVKFKVNSKVKDIAFDGAFHFAHPMSFLIDAASAALQVKIVFRDGDGFIYLPTANIITNLDKATQAKTRALQIPKSVSQIDSKIDQLSSEFDLTAEDTGDVTRLSGKSKRARGAFTAVIDKKTLELRSLVTFNNKGAEEITVEFSSPVKGKVDARLFDKPKNAIEANLPVPLF